MVHQAYTNSGGLIAVCIAWAPKSHVADGLAPAQPKPCSQKDVYHFVWLLQEEMQRKMDANILYRVGDLVSGCSHCN
eukprot:1026389-Amphidinium_carterae.1